MSLDFLPPQAYTKETLLKAYNWLQSQSDQVKELATTPDQLVSLFLKASRNGGQENLQRYTGSQTLPVQDSSDRPSLQNFKSELKNLAGMMGDLEKPPQAVATPTPAMPGAPQPTTPMQAAPQPAAPSGGYDEMTLSFIREVRTELNLSSDIEALRMLVKLGYQKARTLY
jgi:hypothetical protein